MVTIRGENFSPSWKYVCQFGGLALQEAVYATTSEIHCHAPTKSAGNASLQIGYSAGGLLSTGLVVSYQIQAMIDKIHPLKSSRSGGTQITIEGREFRATQQAICYFGRISIPAIIISDRIMTCEVPPNRDRNVELTVEVDGALISQPNLNITYNNYFGQ